MIGICYIILLCLFKGAQGVECMICLNELIEPSSASTASVAAAEDVPVRETVTLNCLTAHTFHRDCIARWFAQAENCPTCRREVDLSHHGMQTQAQEPEGLNLNDDLVFEAPELVLPGPRGRLTLRLPTTEGGFSFFEPHRRLRRRLNTTGPE